MGAEPEVVDVSHCWHDTGESGMVHGVAHWVEVCCWCGTKGENFYVQTPMEPTKGHGPYEPEETISEVHHTITAPCKVRTIAAREFALANSTVPPLWLGQGPEQSCPGVVPE